ncbi:hypothetical protein AOXY_G24279 [Acipenser oxyrinchus oxyrinchus]|uniref:Uncharacterized protein n=1 Tax=Acipenser oxyrinchus oxyrinchus TaxID=40147 RepID=A0AAD8FW05_ACIOX|nr:hypothetical protein AOXY_G24279 [Acipenser oxyrinchus oxyrinchus]
MQKYDLRSDREPFTKKWNIKPEEGQKRCSAPRARVTSVKEVPQRPHVPGLSVTPGNDCKIIVCAEKLTFPGTGLHRSLKVTGKSSLQT